MLKLETMPKIGPKVIKKCKNNEKVCEKLRKYEKI